MNTNNVNVEWFPKALLENGFMFFREPEGLPLFADEKKAAEEKKNDKTYQVSILKMGFEARVRIDNPLFEYATFGSEMHENSSFFKKIAIYTNSTEEDVRKRLKVFTKENKYEALRITKEITKIASLDLGDLESEDLLHLISCKQPAAYTPGGLIGAIRGRKMGMGIRGLIDMVRCKIISELFKVNVVLNAYTIHHEEIFKGRVMPHYTLTINYHKSASTIHLAEAFAFWVNGYTFAEGVTENQYFFEPVGIKVYPTIVDSNAKDLVILPGLPSS